MQANPGDVFLVHTDGLSEAEGPAGLLGTEGVGKMMRKLLRDHPDATSAEICDRLLAKVTGSPDSPAVNDDLTFIVIRRV